MITGASQGIGKSIAKTLCKCGINLCVGCRRPEILRETFAQNPKINLFMQTIWILVNNLPPEYLWRKSINILEKLICLFTAEASCS
jgi:NAD(P)-dependent dehydrogenase (short-subunit alcohol dehydrogenase family)